jgi:hypothetical protein
MNESYTHHIPKMLEVLRHRPTLGASSVEIDHHQWLTKPENFWAPDNPPPIMMTLRNVKKKTDK